MNKNIDNERFKIYVNYLLEHKIANNAGEIALKIGLNRCSISRILHDNWQVSDKIIALLLQKYPELKTISQNSQNENLSDNLKMMQNYIDLQHKIIVLHEENSRLKDTIIELQKKCTNEN